MKFLFILLFLSNSSLWAENDYSACKNATKDEFNVYGYGNGVAPFIINDQGILEKNDGVNSFKHIDERNEDELGYKEEGLVLQRGQIETDIREAMATVKRNDQGEISEIVYNKNYSDSEIAGMVKANIAKTGSSLGSGTLFLPTKTILRFEIKNGKCVPVEKKNIVRSSAIGNSHDVELTEYKTQLCYELNEFMDRNPEAAGCMRSDLNALAEKILSKHINKESNVLQLIPERNRAMPKEIAGSLEYRMQSDGAAVFKAHSILQSCKDVGLSPVIGADVWAEKPKQSTFKLMRAIKK